MKALRVALACLTLLVLRRAHAYDDGDFQVWHTENQEFKINKDAKITLEEEFRWGDDAGEFYYQHYDAGFLYSANKHLELGINYRQVYEKKGSGFKEENRPHLNAILKYELAGFQLDDRSRLEYRHFDWRQDYWRYRNKLSVKFPWKFTRLKIQPYLADEIFLPLNGINLERNRFYCGFGFSISKNIKGDIYYLLQSSKKSGAWTDANVLGTKIKIVF